MFVAWRDLRFATGRFSLMVTVIVLITFLVALLSALTSGLGRASTSAIADLPSDRIVFSAPTDGESPSYTSSSVSPAQWDGWAKNPGVAAAVPLGILPTRAASTVSSDPSTRTASVTAFGVGTSSGIAPEEISQGEVILSTGAADDLSLAQGDSLTLGGLTLTVAEVSGDASYSHTPVVWMTLADWQQLAGTSNATVIALSFADDAPSADQIAATDARLGTTTTSIGGSLSAIGSYSAEHSSLLMMQVFLYLISALVVGAFFTVWTINRRGDIAVMRALGASRGYLLKDAMGQATAVLVGGTAVGIVLAAGVGLLAAQVMPVVVDASTMLVPAVGLIALGLIGAALSVSKVTSVDPHAALAAR